MGIFQLTGNLDSPFDSLNKQAAASGVLSRVLDSVKGSGSISHFLVPELLKFPTSTFVSLFLEMDSKWYGLGDDLNLIGRYSAESEAAEHGAVFVVRTPFNDFFALYNNMNALGEFQKVEGVFEAALNDHAGFVESLGEDMDFFVDLCVYGQISLESSWEENSRGLWQITDAMVEGLVECYDEYNKKSDIDKKSHISSTEAVVDYYNRMYRWFGAKCETIADHYGLNPRDFLIPCLTDAYNCGPARMSKILDLFIEMVEEDLFEGLEGQDVYNQMSRMYLEDGEDKNYSESERQYFYRVQALAGLMMLQTSGYDVSQFRQDLSIE